MDTKRFTNSELSSFCGQLALILRSGISATEGLTVMLDDTTDNTERAILQQILEKQDETGNCRDDRPGFQAAPDSALHPAETPLPVFLRAEIHRRHAEACQPQRHRKAADS